MREISLDTETTGLSVTTGDRITEIGCVEIIDKEITGNTFHLYVNPEKEPSARSVEISGLTYDFLKQFKKFEEIADEFLDFISDSKLIIHNAQFDVGFLNFELSKSGRRTIDPTNVVDTLTMAKEKFPGSPATLDALCRRFSVDASSRTKHGALIDAELLAKVYIHLSVEILQKNIFGTDSDEEDDSGILFQENVDVEILDPRDFSPTTEEVSAHLKFLNKLKKPIWNKFLGRDDGE